MVERRKDFLYRDGPEPHAERKVEILKKYPEIKKLMVHEPRTKFLVAGTVLLQVVSCCQLLWIASNFFK
jgi:sphingolipid delta-4 desaturase